MHPILNKNLLHIRFAYYILNLSAQSSMDMVLNVIIKIKNIVFFIHTSRARLKKFKQMCIDHDRYF